MPPRLNMFAMPVFMAFLSLGLMVPQPLMAETASPFTSAETISGDTLKLKDGRTLRLEGIMAPFATTKSLADAAQQKLQSLTAHQTLTIDNPSTDHYGRLTGQTYVTQEKVRVWLEGEMLRAGLAFIYPPTGSEGHLDEMRKAEQDARQNKRGIWADIAYADIAADDAESHEGHFAFVTGKIVDATRVKNKVYLNFGPDWHEDFTVTIAAHDLRSFKQTGLDPLTLKDKMARVRGWLKRDSGPAMTITNPWQIEILH